MFNIIISILKKYLKINQVVLFSSVAIFFLIIYYLFNHNVLCADDLIYHYLEGGLTFHKNFYYGSWVMPFQYLSLYYIPHKLGLLLFPYSSIVLALIKAFFFSCLLLIIYFTVRSRKIKLFHSVVLSFSLFFILFLLHSKNHYIDFFITEGFFRFVIPSIMTLGCIFLIYQYYVCKKANKYLIAFLSFFTAYSSEIAAEILLIFSFLLSGYYIFSSLKSKEKVSLSSPYFILFVFTFLGFVKLISTTGFIDHFETKTLGAFYSLGQFLGDLPEFIKHYYYSIFVKNSVYWSLFVILGTLNYRIKAFRDNYFGFSLLFTLFVCAFSLYFLGKTHYTGGYWLNHPDIYCFYVAVSFYSLCLLFLPIAEKFSASKVFSYFLIMILLISSFIFAKTFVSMRERIRTLEDYTYLRDKIILFYEYISEPPLLPYYTHIDCVYDSVFGDFYSIKNLDIDPFQYYVYQFDYNINRRYDGFNAVYQNYYPVFYDFKSSEIPPYTILSNREALQEFVKRGGTYDEVLNRKYKFEDLKDKDFVLNRK